MIHPVFVNDAQHHNALQLAHQGRAVRCGAEGFLTHGIDLLCALQHFGRNIAAVRLSEILDPEVAPLHKQPLEGLQSLIQGSLRLSRDTAQSVRYVAVNKIADHAVNLLLQILAVEDLAALGIDQVALLVHDVVIFQHALTRLEVAALHGLLGLLDRSGEHLGVQRRILFHLERVHHAHNTLRTEQTHDVIRHGEIEAALARVALSAGTAAQLVVDSAAFMPLGTENEEPTGRLDLFGLGRGYRAVLGHFFSKQAARRLYRLIVRLGIAGGLRETAPSLPAWATISASFS